MARSMPASAEAVCLTRYDNEKRINPRETDLVPHRMRVNRERLDDCPIPLAPPGGHQRRNRPGTGQAVLNHVHQQEPTGCMRDFLGNDQIIVGTRNSMNNPDNPSVWTGHRVGDNEVVIGPKLLTHAKARWQRRGSFGWPFRPHVVAVMHACIVETTRDIAQEIEPLSGPRTRVRALPRSAN